MEAILIQTTALSVYTSTWVYSAHLTKTQSPQEGIWYTPLLLPVPLKQGTHCSQGHLMYSISPPTSSPHPPTYSTEAESLPEPWACSSVRLESSVPQTFFLSLSFPALTFQVFPRECLGSWQQKLGPQNLRASAFDCSAISPAPPPLILRAGLS